MHEDMLQRLELEAELRHVADRDQLILHYQPIVELESGRITRVEALVRWDHPVKGLLPPPAFIPLAEEQGLIGPIGEWVLLQGCLQARRWQDQFPDAPPLSVHVNLSGRQLEEQRLVAEVVHALETSRLSPRQLTLEITESVLVSDVEAMSVRLRELKGLGVLLASTTSAPATRRSATCAASRSTSSRSTRRSSTGSAGVGRTPPWPTPSSSSATPSSSTPWPRASSSPSRRPTWSPLAARKARASGSPGRWTTGP